MWVSLLIYIPLRAPETFPLRPFQHVDESLVEGASHRLIALIGLARPSIPCGSMTISGWSIGTPLANMVMGVIPHDGS
jgi:hypothetical protein